MGGSYQDTSGGELFNHFFGDSQDYEYADADYGGGDDYGGMLAQMEEEVEQINRDYRGKFKIFQYYASVEEADEHPYVSYDGTFHFVIPEELMLPQSKQKDEVPWNQTPTYKLRDAVRKWANKQNIYNINGTEVIGNEVNINVYDDDDPTPDNYRNFLENMLDVDKKSDKLTYNLYQLFVQYGFAKENERSYINNNFDSHDFDYQFNNFKCYRPSIPIQILARTI